MKQFFIIGGLLAIITSCAGNTEVEIGNKTTLEVERLFDAGNVLKGEVITAKFIVTNTGEFPLSIAEVKGSCTCTVANFPKEPIQVGESGEILAHVNTEQTGVGPLNKSVIILANTNPSTTQLVIRASVMKK